MAGSPIEPIPRPRGDVLAPLDVARQAGSSCGTAVWWAGGGVRDLLRGVVSVDLDLVVEGPLEPFLEQFSGLSGARVVARSRFETARLEWSSLRVDLARARSEEYPLPASLPVIRPATIHEDLVRRDFSVNAMALPIHPPEPWRLLDPAGGRADLAARVLRILHARSFEDDPTRIVRAVDFAARLDFGLEAGTESALRGEIARGGLDRLSAGRLDDVLERLLDDPESVICALDIAAGLGLLAALAPGLRWDEENREALRRAVRALATFPDQPAGGRDVYLLALLGIGGGSDSTAGAGLVARLELPPAEIARLRTGSIEMADARQLSPETRPSEVHRVLSALHPIQLAWLAGTTPRLAPCVEMELARLRPFRLTIGGDELLRGGASPGPHIGAALAATRAARLDAEIGPSDELAFALERLAEAGR
ncbi:MAG: hypothetical protein AB7G12_09120 [Thermoanaerobaculia bacterium]